MLDLTEIGTKVAVEVPQICAIHALSGTLIGFWSQDSSYVEGVRSDVYGSDISLHRKWVLDKLENLGWKVVTIDDLKRLGVVKG